jgi:hypothetical protein
MDVKELAPALLAIGDLFTQANRIVNPPGSDAYVTVRADIKPGSFPVDLQVVQGFAETFKQALISDWATAAVNLVTIVLLGKESVVWLGKQLKGQRPKRAVTLQNGRVRLELPSGDVIEVPADVARVYNDHFARTSLRKALRPLEREGIDVFQVRRDGTVIHEVSKSEIAYFSPSLEAEVITASEREAALEVLKPALKGDYTWMFSDGTSTFHADMGDSEFLEEVASGLAFSKGMILKVKLRSETTRDEEGLHTHHIVMEVDGIVPRVKQLPLNDE